MAAASSVLQQSQCFNELSNLFINETTLCESDTDCYVCIKCSEKSHISKKYDNKLMTRWEQNVIRDLIMSNWDTEINSFFSNILRNSFMSEKRDISVTVSTKLIIYSIAEIDMISNTSQKSSDVKHVEIIFEEDSDSNKRAHWEKFIESNTQTQQNSEVKCILNSQQSSAFQSGFFTGQLFFFQRISAMLPAESHLKKKEQKWTDKTATITLIVDLMNEETGFLNQSMSVQQLLKTQKIDLIWINFCIWLSTVCWKLKRLLTQMSNRKCKSKITENTDQNQDQAENVNAIAVDSNTHFLSSVMSIDKTFQISCKIQIGGKKLILQQHQVQADQNSDMNVISLVMIKQLDLKICTLFNIRFTELIMKTADNQKIRLHHWVYLKISVESIWRTIRCFIVSDLDLLQKLNHLSLLLEILWLYSVNAIIEICESQIEIEDSVIEKSIQDMIESELMFLKEHNLLMYLKAILILNTLNSSDKSDENNEDSDSSVSLSDEEEKNEVTDQSFH